MKQKYYLSGRFYGHASRTEYFRRALRFTPHFRLQPIVTARALVRRNSLRAFAENLLIVREACP